MRTDELIVQLARSVKPITPLPLPGVRAARWLAIAALVMIAAVVLYGPRKDLGSALGQPIFLASLGALLLTLTSGAAAAFALSVPGASRSPLQRALPLFAVATWSLIWAVTLAVADAAVGRRTAPFHAACAIQIAAGALLTGPLLFAMIARAAPLQRMRTAIVASLAAMAAGAAAAQVLCPLDDPRHQLIGHVIVALVVAASGVFVGRRTLRA